MSARRAIEYLVPGASYAGDYITDDAGTITAWRRPEPQPTHEEIAAAMLPAARAARIEAVKTERDRRKFEGVYVGANRFHSDADSRTQQIGLVLMGANLPAVQWKTMGGSFVTMTPTLAGQIFGATAQRDITVFAVAEAHIAAINLLDDPDAVMAYDITTGWPA